MDSIKSLTIAIDGYSSTGKSTLAKQIADELDMVYVDSGAMYRAVSLYALRNNWVHPESGCLPGKIESDLHSVSIAFQKDASGKIHTLLNGEDVEEEIRTMKVSNVVSHVAELGPVRKRLVSLQQEMGAKGGVVMDGRDIGTVVFPKAELKIFMTASEEIRAARRKSELDQKGQTVSLSDVMENLKARDLIDTTRSDSPLTKAKDARILDNSNLTREEQFDRVMTWVRQVQAAQQA